MPKPVRGGQRYLPGLDGLRALAVFAVVAYHLGLGWAQGGLLGVGVFFTLSGYLITDILLSHWSDTGALGLGDFWLRRARRLLPALFVMLAAVTVWVSIAQPGQLPSLRGDVLASALYVSNWWYIAQHASYFAQFGPPSPLDHLWSLAVEEQFYLLWPWLLLAGLWLFGRRFRGSRYALAAVTLGLAAASAVAMATIYHPGFDPTRAYEGTDTRAFGLLIGAALAMVWPTRQSSWPAASRWILDAAGAAGLAVIALMVWRTTEYSAFMYRGGLVVLSVATALVVAAAVHPASSVGKILGLGPLRWLGVRSYGIYLWHYPVIVLTAAAVSTSALSPAPPSGMQDIAMAAAAVAIAAVSWRFVEEPIRRGLRRRPGDGTATGRLEWRGALIPAVAASAMVLALLAGVAADLRALTGRTGGGLSAEILKTRHALTVSERSPGRRHAPRSRERLAVASGPLRTSCRAVVHIGDSTSDGLISPDYLPDPADRITARYAAIGITQQHMEISGGRSIVETILDQPNAYQVASSLVDSGYHGCWVLALGTNDTADVYVGSPVGRIERIERMMSLIGNQPVLWINVRSLVPSGPYSEQDMLLWNQALEQEAPHYPDMRIYDWAAVVQPSWYIPDGIHFTSYGYEQRSRLIADALARAFPATGSAGAGGANPDNANPEQAGSGSAGNGSGGAGYPPAPGGPEVARLPAKTPSPAPARPARR
jgi:peptidoglycan/LPS O-acetylase OafA/YrhL